MSEVPTEKIRRILSLDITGNDAGVTTVREYLLSLLANVWRDEESFNGKRPFGYSDWRGEIYRPLITAGLVAGILDEDGYITELDYDAVDRLVLACIAALAVPLVAGNLIPGKKGEVR